MSESYLRAEDYPVLAEIWGNDEDDAAFSTCVCGHSQADHIPACAASEPCGGSEVAYCLECWTTHDGKELHEYQWDDGNPRIHSN
jgi:hypothetical protein